MGHPPSVGGIPNPWVRLADRPPYLAEVDLPYASWLASRRPDLDLESIPQPHVGCAGRATVVSLELTPHPEPRQHEAQADPRYTAERRKLLTFDTTPPFLYLGDQWWKANGKPRTSEARRFGRITAPLARSVGGRAPLAERLLVLEYLGYVSLTYRPLPGVLPSQLFTFDLLRGLIIRNVLVVVGRGYDAWTWHVPELVGHEQRGRVIRLRSVHQQSLSPGNMSARQYDLLCEALTMRVRGVRPWRFIGFPDEYQIFRPDGSEVPMGTGVDWDHTRREAGFDPNLLVYERDDSG